MRPVLLLLGLLAAAPAAAALDAFPGETRAGDAEARFLVRVDPAKPLRVEADAAVAVALARHGEEPDAFQPAPADLRAPPGASWHGLPGVLEVVVRRDDPARDVLVTLWQDGEGGLALEWAAVQKPVPGGGAAGLLAAAGIAWGATRTAGAAARGGAGGRGGAGSRSASRGGS